MKLHAVFQLCLVILLASAPLRAGQAKYLPAGKPDAIELLAAPSAPNTPEGQADLEETLVVHQKAKPEQIAQAAGENKLTIFHFAPAIGPWFVPGKFPKTEALFKQVEVEAKAASDSAKKLYKHPRPYHLAPESFAHSIEHEDPTHYSYPSGHSTRGTVFALLLAELFPEHRAALIEKGRDTGWLRVVGGVHFPSDVYAGRVLGQALAREFLLSATLQHDLAEVRAELAAGK